MLDSRPCPFQNRISVEAVWGLVCPLEAVGKQSDQWQVSCVCPFVE